MKGKADIANILRVISDKNKYVEQYILMLLHLDCRLTSLVTALHAFSGGWINKFL